MDLPIHIIKILFCYFLCELHKMQKDKKKQLDSKNIMFIKYNFKIKVSKSEQGSPQMRMEVTESTVWKFDAYMQQHLSMDKYTWWALSHSSNVGRQPNEWRVQQLCCI